MCEITSNYRIPITVDEILSKKNMDAAMEHLMEKSPVGRGVDGIMVSQFQEYWSINGRSIMENVRKGTFEPGMVGEFEMVSVNGKKRKLNSFNCTDRLLLRAISQIMQPACEKFFSKQSHGYRPERGVKTAIESALQYLNEGYVWVGEIDIEHFFDTIPITDMVKCINEYFELDEVMQQLLKSYLRCKVSQDGKVVTKQKGLVQGSPLSPTLSNLYLHELDVYLDMRGYHYIRYSDDLNLYCISDEEASTVLEDARGYLERLHLKVNKDKTGVYEAKNRFFLGYYFEKDRRGKYLASPHKYKENYYSNWHQTAIQRIDRNYHIINDGILSKRDYTILFENSNGKKYLPVETIDSLNMYSNIILSSNFLEYVSKKKLRVSLFDRYGNRIGTFVSDKHGSQGKTMMKQAKLYLDENVRLDIAKRIDMAAMHNIRSNLRYYKKKKQSSVELEKSVGLLSETISKMNETQSIEALMLLEARGRQEYYKAFNHIIEDENYSFTMRTKRPPKDAINALISFGNTYLYNRIATEIQKTSLDIRIGFLHATTNRSESLNLDISELFKPVIVDRVIFTMINRRMLQIDSHFEKTDNGGIYLSRQGKKIFLEQLEAKIYSKTNVGDESRTYDSLMRKEIQKIYRLVIYGEKYKPYKYTT